MTSSPQLLIQPKLVVANRIPDCLLPKERRPLDTDAIRYLVVHRVSLAAVGIPDLELDGPKLVAWQRTQPGLTRGCYHLLIKPGGEVEQMLPLSQRGAHSVGYNSRSIAVAIVGDFRDHVPETAQFASLIKVGEALMPLCREMVAHSDLPGGSRDPKKVCPGRIAISLVDQAVAGRLPAGWATWERPRALEWARGAGVVV